MFRHVIYITADGHVHDLYFRLGDGGRWRHRDVTNSAKAPASPSRGFLTSWADPAVQHVIYQDTGHIYELYLPIGDDEWRYCDLTVEAGGPLVEAGSYVTSWWDSNFRHVSYFTPDMHVHELWSPIGISAWADHDLTAITGAPVEGAWNALTSWVDPNHQHVVYLTSNQRVHELYFRLGGGPWAHGDLTAAAGAPLADVGLPLTSWVDPNFQHLVYVTANGHVHELYFRLGGGPWAHGDLTAAAGAPLAEMGPPMTSWVDPNFQHVVYMTPNGHVQELYFRLGGGPWAHSDLTAAAGAPPAPILTSGELTAVNTYLTSWVEPDSQHVVYETADGHLNELYFRFGGGTWAHNDLTAKAGAPSAEQSSSLTSWVA